MDVPIVDLSSFVSTNPWIQKLRRECFGMILPNGWFGRPFDDQHSLKAITVFGHQLKIVFDDIREIEIIDPKYFEIKKLSAMHSSLKLSGSKEVTFSWTPYGEEQSGKRIITKFDSPGGNRVEIVGYFPKV